MGTKSGSGLRRIGMVQWMAVVTGAAFALCGSVLADEQLAAVATESVQAAQQLSPAKQESVRRAACEILLLDGCSRLLPKAAAGGEVARILETLLARPADSATPEELSKLPPADELVFNGERLMGGNFGYVDNLIGKDGLPVAMDRQMPTLIVPITMEAADTLARSAEKFRATKESALILARTDRFHVVKVSPTLVGDGVFVRPYAGRFDDLFFHLVQEGTAVGQLQFYGVMDGMPEQTYHPVAGLGGAGSVPPIWFNLSDIFSEGAHDAVRRYREERGNIGRNPFRTLAWHVIPFLREGGVTAKPGAEFTIPETVLAAALKNRQRFSPPSVPPLFHDPSRFLGALRSDWRPVVNVKELRTVIESSLALPDRTDEPAGNQVLQQPGGLPVWEDPKEAPALPTPSVAQSGPTPESATPASPAPAPAAEMPVARATLARTQVAVLTPTIDEAESFVQQMAASEQQLSANARTLRRVQHFIRSLSTMHEALAETGSSAELRPRLEAEIVRWGEMETELHAIQLQALDARAELRHALERRLRGERMRQLKELTASAAAL